MKQVVSKRLRNTVMFVLYSWAGLASYTVFGQTNPGNILWYNEPAKNWFEALPVGNGRIGAMIYGGAPQETIQLNEATIWAGGPYRNDNPAMRGSLDKIRALIFAGDFAQAEELALQKMISPGAHGMPYQTAGELRLDFPGHETYQGYQRTLNIDSAVATTRYSVSGVQFRREVFTSLKDNILIIRLSANTPGNINFTLTADRAQATTRTTAGNLLILSGKTSDHEGITGRVTFETQVRITTDGGRIESTGKSLKVTNANSVLLYVSIGTNFRSYNDVSGNASQRAATALKQAVRKDYKRLKADHVTAYKKLFDRVSLSLGTSPQAAKPTQERIREFATTNDPQLVSLYFQFGRYLLISSSQPGGQPSTLQGIWNNELIPAWDSKYTININTEMNYWPAEVTNLPEMHGPLMDLIHDLSETGRETARTMYGSRGWVAHHNTDLWRATGAVDGPPGIWPTGAAWLSQHLWQKYTYNGDTKYLKGVYPILREASLFFLDFLVKEPTHGWRVVSPSISPENAPYAVRKQWKVITAGATLDNQLVFDLFSKTIQAAKVLNQSDTLIAQLEAARADWQARSAAGVAGRLGQPRRPPPPRIASVWPVSIQSDLSLPNPSIVCRGPNIAYTTR